MNIHKFIEYVQTELKTKYNSQEQDAFFKVVAEKHLEESYDSGYNVGYDHGREEGYGDGYAQGQEDAEEEQYKRVNGIHPFR